MPPVNDSNNIPGSAGGPLVNGNSAGNNSSNDNVKKFTFPSHQFHMVHLAKMCQENKEYTDCVIRVGNADGGCQQDQELRAHRLGTIYILRKQFYSTKINLTSKFFTKTFFFVKSKEFLFQRYISMKFSCCSV